MIDIKEKDTERGFERVEFKDKYNNDCSIQVSSNIESQLWIGVNENRMLIEQEDCIDIAMYLLRFYYEGKLYKKSDEEKR